MDPRDRARARRRMAPVMMTLGAWLIAFLVVWGLLTALGDELQSLPLALRALVISGVLVTLMVNLVMPVLSTAVARSLGGEPNGGSQSERPTVGVGGEPGDGSRVVARE